MPQDHTVKQGEYLRKIAQAAGFPDYNAIWSSAENSELKQKRQNPNILLPGDKLVIPDKQEKQESGGTDQRHRFRLKGKPLKLRIVLRDTDDNPVANKECTLIIEGVANTLTTDGDGKLEQVIPPSASNGSLRIDEDEISLLIGHLDPIDELSGQQGRLNNLGYDAGSADDAQDTQFLSAVEEFQCDYDLTVDGICGPNTQAKLKEVHGC
jgi:hypothetical protein